MSKIRFFLLWGLIIATIPLYANNYKPEKRIYLMDLSGSMTGLGSVRTDNVLDKMKADLKGTINWVPTNSDFVFIPFTEDISPYIKGTSEEKPVLIGHISDIDIMPGNTDIASAWERGLAELDSTKVNYLFLLSDGYHNRGIPKQKLYSILREGLNIYKNYDAEAYFVLLSPQYRTTEVAKIFDSTYKMQVVESMNIIRQDMVSGESTDASIQNSVSENTDQSSIAQTMDGIDKQHKKCSWRWLWIALIILLVIILALLSIFLLKILTPMLIYFLRNIPMLQGIPSSNGHWTGKEGNSKWCPNREYIPSKGQYCNIGRKTWGEILDSYGIDGINFKKGVADFSRISKYPVKFNWEKELSQKELYDLCTSNERSALHEVAYRKMAKQYGFSSVDELKRIKESLNLVPHERIDGTIELVPRDIHDAISHKGGVYVFQQYYKSKHKI